MFIFKIFIYLCHFKRTIKNISVLALSLLSFICLQAVPCSFFFFSSIFSFPADSAAGMKAASGSGVALCFRWPLCFLFFWSVFAARLKKFHARLRCARGRARSKWPATAEWPLKWFPICEKSQNRSKDCRRDGSTRGSFTAAPTTAAAAPVGHGFRPPLQSLHLYSSLPTPTLTPTLSSSRQSLGEGRWLAAVDFSS